MTLDLADDILYNFLYQEYPTYRTSLQDPTVLPAATDILWGEPVSQLKAHGFEVLEGETFATYPWIGMAKVQYRTVCTVRITTRWINAGKPPVLNQFREFLNNTVNKNLAASYFRDKGIHEIAEERSAIIEPTATEGDVWRLEYNVLMFSRRSY